MVKDGEDLHGLQMTNLKYLDVPPLLLNPFPTWKISDIQPKLTTKLNSL